VPFLTDAKRQRKVERQTSGQIVIFGALPRKTVLATIVHLLVTMLIRVGNDEYAAQNNSYGLTTLKNPPSTATKCASVLLARAASNGRLRVKDQRAL
jgi:DNA topoisomerase I